MTSERELAASEEKAFARMARIADHPGFARAPRLPMVHTLDPDTMTLAAELARQDGALAFAALPPAQVQMALADTLGPDWQAGAWDVYEAGPEPLLTRAVQAARRLPMGWRADQITDPLDSTVLEIARLNQTCGVSPNTGAALRGAFCPIHTTGLYDPDGVLRASATVQMMFPQRGRLFGIGFLGLICVDPAQRGMGLGACVTGHVLAASHARLAWTEMSAWVAPDNPGSIALMRRFGLTRREDVRALVAMPGGARFTR